MLNFKSKKLKECEEDLAELQNQLNTAESRIKDYHTKEEDLRGQIKDLEVQNQQDREEIEKLKDLEHQNMQLAKELHETKRSMESVKFDLSQSRSQYKKKETEIMELTGTLENTERDLELAMKDKNSILTEGNQMRNRLVKQEHEIEEYGNRARAAEQISKELKAQLNETIEAKDKEINRLREDKKTQDSEIHDIEDFLTKNKPKRRRKKK